jgi:hypothetical protein
MGLVTWTVRQVEMGEMSELSWNLTEEGLGLLCYSLQNNTNTTHAIHGAQVRVRSIPATLGLYFYNLRVCIPTTLRCISTTALSALLQHHVHSSYVSVEIHVYIPTNS